MSVRTKESARPNRDNPFALTMDPSIVTGGRDLIRTMLEYETAARENGTDLSANCTRRLNAVEREFLQAELVADLLRLSVNSPGESPGSRGAALVNFCVKICDMALPSYELLGTYLAAVDIANADERLRESPSPVEVIRCTMITVLRTCADLLKKKTVSFEQMAA